MPSRAPIRPCDCGAKATVFHRNAWVCERCKALDKLRHDMDTLPPPKPRVYAGSDYGVLTLEGRVWMDAH